MLRRPVESAQYVSIRYTERLAQAGIDSSVGSKGDSYAHALAETISGLYKAELIRQLARSTELNAFGNARGSGYAPSSTCAPLTSASIERKDYDLRNRPWLEPSNLEVKR